jgi:hypothetical protein
MFMLVAIHVLILFCVPLWFTTLMTIVLVFLLFKIPQQLDTERSLVKDLRGQGYGDRQLQELGFSQAAVHEPSVAAMKK